jgi:hypothetical protein
VQVITEGRVPISGWDAPGRLGSVVAADVVVASGGDCSVSDEGGSIDVN